MAPGKGASWKGCQGLWLFRRVPGSQVRSKSSTPKRLGKGWGLPADAEGAGAEEVGARSRMEVVAMPVTQGPGEALTVTEV